MTKINYIKEKGAWAKSKFYNCILITKYSIHATLYNVFTKNVYVGNVWYSFKESNGEDLLYKKYMLKENAFKLT